MATATFGSMSSLTVKVSIGAWYNRLTRNLGFFQQNYSATSQVADSSVQLVQNQSVSIPATTALFIYTTSPVQLTVTPNISGSPALVLNVATMMFLDQPIVSGTIMNIGATAAQVQLTYVTGTSAAPDTPVEETPVYSVNNIVPDANGNVDISNVDEGTD